MEERAQGALEYLLLIGGAVLVAAIVLYLLSSMGGTGKHAVSHAEQEVSQALENLKNLV